MSDLTSWIGIKQRPPDCRLTPNPHHPLRKGLVFLGGVRWPGSRRYDDASGLHNHGTCTNMDFPPTSTSGWAWSGELGRAVTSYLAASSTHVAATASNVPDAISISVWINSKAVNVWEGFFCASKNGMNDIDHGFNVNRYSASADIGFDARGGGGIYVGFMPTGWFHLAGVASTAGVAVYINGVKRGEGGSRTGPFQLERIAVGSRYVGAYNYFCTAQIADPMIWSRVLSPAEICALADPAATMFGGLLLPPRRVLFAGTGVPWVYSRMLQQHMLGV